LIIITSFLIFFGVQIDPESEKLFCENLKEINANYAALWIKRNEIDKGNGNYYWGSVDDKINKLQRCGLKIAVHLQSLKGKDENFNMSIYMDFLKALSIRYKGKIERYSIENKAVAKHYGLIVLKVILLYLTMHIAQ